MGKREAESCNKISIAWLKRHDYFPQEDSYKSGVVTWTSGWGDKNSVSISVKKSDATKQDHAGYVRLWYAQTDHEGEKTSIDYKVELTTTRCHYGGKRYWFICPLVKNGQPCQRRVGTLYMYSKYFGCRHCGELTYSSRNQGGRFRCYVTAPDLEEQEAKISRYFYKGKPTRKYRRLMKMEERFVSSWIEMVANLQNKKKHDKL